MLKNKPTINLNGTDRNTLFQQYRVAFLKCNEVMKHLETIEFNARDYPQGTESWQEARSEFVTHHLAISQAMEYFLDLAQFVSIKK